MAEECISALTIILRKNQEKRQLNQQPTLISNNNANDAIDNIKKLAELKDAGILSLEEFEEKKAELMSRI